jgi:hypothetical protein
LPGLSADLRCGPRRALHPRRGSAARDSVIRRRSTIMIGWTRVPPTLDVRHSVPCQCRAWQTGP